MGRRSRHGLLAILGFILSPLSWWNDLIVNVPLAYLFSWPFALIDEALFLPAFILGYWLTNISGLILLHRGAAVLIQPDKAWSPLQDVVISILYTTLIGAAVWLGWLPSPTSFLR